MLESYPFDAKDVAPLLEIVLEAYTWLGMQTDSKENEVLGKFSAGKSKKLTETISKLTFVEVGEAAEARRQALQTRVQKRIERAEQFSFLK